MILSGSGQWVTLLRFEWEWGLESALVDTPVETVMLKQLVKTPLNARKTPVSDKDVRELATSIEAAGLLQNLIGVRLSNGLFGIAGGETRRRSLNLLMEEGRSAAGVPVTPEFQVVVKAVDEDKARAISYAENGQRSNLSPADQLANFRELAEEGKPVEQIAAILGYRTAHVKKCLKLTTVAPQLLELLKTDAITLDQLGALSSTDDHQRQIQTLDNSKHYEYKRTVKALRESVLHDEVSAAGNALVEFVGLDAYQAAGGETREDLFAESVILTNPQQLETMAIAKLQEAADIVAKEEGWAWVLGRRKDVQSWGGDEKTFEVLHANAKLTDEQKAEAKQLADEKQQLKDLLDGGDADDEWEHAPRVEQITSRLAEINKWSAKVRAKAGVVAYLKNGEIHIQRGLMKMEDIKQVEKAEREKVKNETPPSEKGLSAVLVTSLSAERTLAVAASLAQNPTVALAMHTFTLARRIFDKGSFHTMHTTVESQRSACLKQSEDADSLNGVANQKLTELHSSWLNRFPLEWFEGFDWLLAWPQEDVLALLAYCVSQSIDGVSSQVFNKRVANRLEPLEKALNFQIGEWWKPTSANYFSRIGKDQIVDALDSAGRTGNARDAEKMKRKEAAEFAESILKDTGWLPVCMAPIDLPQTKDELTGDANTGTETDATADDSAAA
ncbi:ParB/RepB/Spo0J family partition protein [Serratia sp. N21D137]|uniref:ParB/RepB/Spo0J family partition protein n=1 Tax=Serratia sp. N21D137 TaxID=3397495 RepID=UPI0039DF8810